ncbi:MAG: serine/threonine protein kinase, partial [Psychromonas sp.]
QSINNPSIMSIAKNIKNSVFLYHICEHVEGISLRQWISENPHPELQQVNSIISKVVNAVRVLQRAGMVHRDLKPENIMLTAEQNIKILDFGTVRVNGFEEIVKEQQEEPLGAVDYIAPEYLNNNECSALSDLFSIAVITYEMLSGQLPYPDNQAQSLDRARQYTWEYSAIYPLRPDLSTRLDKVLQKALHQKPSQRYTSMSEFIGDLTKVQQRQVAKAPKKSLLERDPVKFWQWLAFIFMGISTAQLFIMLRDSF